MQRVHCNIRNQPSKYFDAMNKNSPKVFLKSILFEKVLLRLSRIDEYSVETVLTFSPRDITSLPI